MFASDSPLFMLDHSVLGLKAKRTRLEQEPCWVRRGCDEQVLIDFSKNDTAATVLSFCLFHVVVRYTPMSSLILVSTRNYTRVVRGRINLGATSPRLAGFSASCGSSRRGSWMKDSGSAFSCSWANGASVPVVVLCFVPTLLQQCRGIHVVLRSLYRVPSLTYAVLCLGSTCRGNWYMMALTISEATRWFR